MHKIRGAHLQCVNNHFAKFEYKGMKTIGSYRLHKPDTPYAFGMEKISKVNTPKKLRKYLSNVHKIEGAHLQCLNNHYANLNVKG